MHAGLFNVLHDARYKDVARRIAHGVDVDLDGVFQKTVQEYRTTLGHSALASQRSVGAGEIVHHPGEGLIVVHDLHRAPAQHVTRAHEHRVTNLLYHGLGPTQRERRVAGRLAQSE